MADQEFATTPKRIVSAVLIGVILFALLTVSPILWLKILGVSLDGPKVEQATEPVFLDGNGIPLSEARYWFVNGFDEAKRRHITDHEECNRMAKHSEAVGCHEYVTQQKRFPPHIRQGDFDSGKTTEQCRSEVAAYWSPRIEDMKERGDFDGASYSTTQEFLPEMGVCENYDNVRITKGIHEPTSRLQEILAKMKYGVIASDQDRAIVLRDLAGVSTFRDSPFKEYYLAKSQYFFQLADGKIKPPEKPRLDLSCDEFQAKLGELILADQEDQTAQTEIKRRSGAIEDLKQWNALHQAMVERQWDRKAYLDAARAAGCLR